MNAGIGMLVALSAYLMAAGFHLVEQEDPGAGAGLCFLGWVLLMMACIESDRPKKK